MRCNEQAANTGIAPEPAAATNVDASDEGVSLEARLKSGRDELITASPGDASVTEITLAWILRAAIGMTAVIHAMRGNYLFLSLCVAALVVVVIPAVILRTNKVNIPVELELVLLWWLVSDMTLGRLAFLYDSSIWFDKALHLGNSFLLAMLAFLASYVLHLTGRLRAPAVILGILIVLVTLGLGAIWELAEYFSDLQFGLGAQGSPLLEPLDDTMWDLMLDGFGGVLGGILGPIYIRYSRRSRARLRSFATLGALAFPPGAATK